MCHGPGDRPAMAMLMGYNDAAKVYRSTPLAHLGKVACCVGRPFRFDAATQSIVDDPEASGLTRRPGRKAIEIPDLG